MEISLGFAQTERTISVPETWVQDVLRPNPLPMQGEGGMAEVVRSLGAPIQSKPLHELVEPGQKIAIITSDGTRPVPSALILPPVLEELARAGVADADITVVFALGSHGFQDEQTKRRLVGDAVYERLRCVDSDPGDCLRLGTTGSGTPVDVCRDVAQADVRIAIGNVEYHYFAGYSGGDKALMPGVSSREAIEANHSLMVQPGAAAGHLQDNPVRRDIEEAAAFCPLDFIVNVVLDEHKQILRCFSGHHIAAHREACACLDQLYGVPVEACADVVLVSAGGYPKDQNMYQAQKALDNARHAVKEGGCIIWVAACNQGMGSETFGRWMKEYAPQERIERIRSQFVLGGHKAAAIAMAQQRAKVVLISDLEEEEVKSLHLIPKKDVQQAVEEAMAAAGTGASLLVMPYGGSTLPLVNMAKK